jgi:hypothetical protein
MRAGVHRSERLERRVRPELRKNGKLDLRRAPAG